MRSFAYCAASFAESARKAAGVEPVLSPPSEARFFIPRRLEGHDFLYFDLHGRWGDPAWYGDHQVVALTAEQIRQADLSGAVVFASSCYLADGGSPMLDALLTAGVRYVIGGDGANWSGQRLLFGASLLGQWVRLLMERGFDPLWALTIAKRRLRLQLVTERLFQRVDHAEAARDTLEFRAYYRPGLE